MSEPASFLNSLSTALSALALYSDGHPAVQRAVDGAYRHLTDLQTARGPVIFTFLPEEVLFGRELLPELERWEWSSRFAKGGVERLEIDGAVSQPQFERFVAHLGAVLGLAGDARADLWQGGPEGLRFGRVRLDAGDHDVGLAPALPVATLNYSLREERDAVSWVHQEVSDGHSLPLLEAYGVVRSLSLAMHGGQVMMLPLLRLKEFDQYTTTHSMNVAVLSMALGEFLGSPPAAVRAFGLAGLLHDLGKVRIPRDILVKPGKLTPEERAVIEAHPVDGAKLILQGKEPLDLAAVVAYEHHRYHDGGGYPHVHYERGAHQASRLVHVCDVYDALRTRRPYRDAWSSSEALSYIQGRAGSEFDPPMVAAFVEMMRQWDDRIAMQEME